MEGLLFVMLGVVVGGAAGARIQGFDAWRGAVVALFGSVLVAVLSLLFAIENLLLNILIFVVGVGVLGGALKLPGRALSSVVLGAALFGAVVVALGDSF
ncbi:MAG: hypothetical protein JNK47_00225 [Mesorhizobium sp.]|nr:hypothetical protein [Mesorhizobium sp.]MBL8575622.1 hypothetical protein [Mesorhizobium sp.]